jgi:signal transduction histidine kinase
VFERFHRVDPSRVSSDGGGSGLGLTIARALVKDHGGVITASSAGVGQGACFTVTLPAASA